MLNLAVRKYGLGNTSHVLRTCESAYLNHDGHRDLMVEEDVGRYVQVYTNIYKLEVDNRSPRCSYKCGLKATRCNRELLTDTDRGQFPIARADAWVLQQ